MKRLFATLSAAALLFGIAGTSLAQAPTSHSKAPILIAQGDKMGGKKMGGHKMSGKKAGGKKAGGKKAGGKRPVARRPAGRRWVARRAARCSAPRAA